VKITEDAVIDSLRGQFPTQLFPKKSLFKMIQQMSIAARHHNLRVPLSPEDLYRVHVSGICEKTTFILFIHVPLISDSLELYRYENLPEFIQRNSSSFHYVVDKKSRHEFIAVDAGKSFFLPLKASELQTCFRIAGYFICERAATIYRRDFESTCISAIFASLENGVRMHCQLFVRRLSSPSIFSAGEGYFMVQTPKNITFSTRCENGSEANEVIFPGNQIIQVQAGCFATIGHEFRLEHLPMIRADLRQIEYSVASAFKSVLKDGELDKVLDFIENDQSGALPGRSFGELNSLINSMHQAESFQFTKSAILTVLLVILLVSVAFIVHRLYKCYRHRKGESKPVATLPSPQSLPEGRGDDDISRVIAPPCLK